MNIFQLIAIVIWYVFVIIYAIESSNLYKTDGWVQGEKSNNVLKTILFCLPVLFYFGISNFK